MAERSTFVASCVTAAVMLVLPLGGCSSDAADQRVIDRLSGLDVLAVPAGATELSRASHKGGGADVAAIRGASSVTVVYASPQAPTDVARAFHARHDATWNLTDNGAAPRGGWASGGALRMDPGTVATVEARPPAAAGRAPSDSGSVVTVAVSATRS
ncbi:MAG TPA: hypothetical protein VFN43_11265 [Humibacillus sp.]|nr:hypothetical protein [Humibacillus sp.]